MIIVYACLVLVAAHALLPGSDLRRLGLLRLRHSWLVWLALADQIVVISVLPDGQALSEGAHLAVRRRIGDQRLGIGELSLRVAQCARLLRNGIKLGELAGEADIVVTGVAGGKHGRDGLVAADQRAQAFLRDRGGHERSRPTSPFVIPVWPQAKTGTHKH